MTRVAYVSGGGTGIGRATAAALAGDGWAVVVLGRRPDPLAGTVAAVRAEVPGAQLHAVAADLAEPDQVERAVAEAAAAVGPDVDAVVNAAGGTSPLPAGTLAEVAAEWTDEWRLNVLTAVLLTTAVLPRRRLVRGGQGRPAPVDVGPCRPARPRRDRQRRRARVRRGHRVLPGLDDRPPAGDPDRPDRERPPGPAGGRGRDHPLAAQPDRRPRHRAGRPGQRRRAGRARLSSGTRAGKEEVHRCCGL